MITQKGETVQVGISEKAQRTTSAGLFPTSHARDVGVVAAVPVGKLFGNKPFSSTKVEIPALREVGQGAEAELLINPRPLPRWKACLDATCIFILSPVLLPVLLAIALWIKLVSRGPIIFKQERVGYLGMPFTILKFRTMRVGACVGGHQTHVKNLIQSEAPMTKMDSTGDGRLIPLGVWLRATGLDELPQLINVLRGEMSLVGPRPCTFYEFDHYLPWHKERFNTLPGLTGLWQVSGKNKTTFTQMMKLDIRYARNLSLGLDLAIISKTFSVLVGQLFEAVLVKLRRKLADRDTRQVQGESVVSLSQSAE